MPRVRVPQHVARLFTRLVVDYFAYTTRSGALARRASTILSTLRVRVPRHVARLVMQLIVDYFVCRDFVLRPHWLYLSHAVRHDYLSRDNTGSTSSTLRAAAMSSSGRIASTIHLD
jgi:hypothetical protein